MLLLLLWFPIAAMALFVGVVMKVLKRRHTVVWGKKGVLLAHSSVQLRWRTVTL